MKNLSIVELRMEKHYAYEKTCSSSRNHIMLHKGIIIIKAVEVTFCISPSAQLTYHSGNVK